MDIPDVESEYIDLVRSHTTHQNQWKMYAYTNEVSMLRNYLATLPDAQSRADFVRRHAARFADALINAWHTPPGRGIVPHCT